MKASFVFFDVGETLLHKPSLIPELTELLRRHGQAVPVPFVRTMHKALTEIQDFPSTTHREFYMRFNALLLQLIGVVPSETLVEEIFLKLKNCPWEAVPGLEALDEIELPVGVLSNWDLSLRKRLADLVPFEFSLILGSEEMGSAKPNLAIFQEAALRAHVSPAEVLMVGDSMRLDIAPATRLGMHTALYDPYDLYPYHQGVRVRSITEIPALLSGEG